jgi:hypothetical protein
VSLRRGVVYQSGVPGGRAQLLLALSEQDWNDVIPDGIAVPIFDRGEGQQPSLMLVAMGETLFADCTKVQTVLDEFWGAPVGPCPTATLQHVEVGVRAFLTLDELKAGRPAAPAGTGAADWWPTQGLVRYVEPPINGQRKMHGVISEDAWNVISPSWTTLRLTSHSKGWRSRWRVPVTGGFVVSGDLFATPRGGMDSKPPRAPRPSRLVPAELSAIAERLERTLALA